MAKTMADIEALIRSHRETHPATQVTVSVHVINELKLVYGLDVLSEVYRLVEQEIALELRAEAQLA